MKETERVVVTNEELVRAVWNFITARDLELGKAPTTAKYNWSFDTNGNVMVEVILYETAPQSNE